MRSYPEMQKRVEHDLKDHEYTKVVHSDGVVVWRCKRPNTNCYSFDITCSDQSITMTGDISSLVWRIGRGLGFLAGEDRDYYIYSKLEPEYRDQKELNKDYFVEVVCQIVCMSLGIDEGKVGCGEMSRLYLNKKINEIYYTHEFYKELTGGFHGSVIDDAMECSELTEAYELLRGLSGICPDWWDFTIARPKWDIVYRMYMVCEAAKRILEQEKDGEGGGDKCR